MFMRKFLFFMFVLVAANCVAQEKGEVTDTVDVSEIMERPSIPQYDLKEMDWVDICENPKYAIVTRDDLKGIYDMELHKNVTRIEFQELAFSKQMMMEDSTYVSSFYFKRGIKAGLLSVFEETNSTMSVYSDDPDELYGLEKCTTIDKKMSKKSRKMLKAFIEEQQLDNAQVVIQDANTGHLKTWVALDANMEKEYAGKLLVHSCAGSLIKPFCVAVSFERSNLYYDSIYHDMTYKEGIKRLNTEVMFHAFEQGFGEEYAKKRWKQFSNTKVPYTCPVPVAAFYTCLVNNGMVMFPTMHADSVETENDIFCPATIHELSEVLRVDKAESPQLAWLTDATSWYGYATTEDIHAEGTDTVIGKQIQFAGVFPADAPRYTICVVANRLSTDADIALLKDIVNPLSEWLLKQK